VAERVLNVPARVAQPQNLVGWSTLHSPAYATSVGLLRWAMSDNQIIQPRAHRHRLWRMGPSDGQFFTGTFAWIKRLETGDSRRRPQ
jgi:cell division ATPase FtsA